MNTPLRILIVDDSPLDAELLVLTLKRVGFAPSWTVTDNAAGLTAAVAERPATWGSSTPVMCSGWFVHRRRWCRLSWSPARQTRRNCGSRARQHFF